MVVQALFRSGETKRLSGIPVSFHGHIAGSAVISLGDNPRLFHMIEAGGGEAASFGGSLAVVVANSNPDSALLRLETTDLAHAPVMVCPVGVSPVEAAHAVAMARTADSHLGANSFVELLNSADDARSWWEVAALAHLSALMSLAKENSARSVGGDGVRSDAEHVADELRAHLEHPAAGSSGTSVVAELVKKLAELDLDGLLAEVPTVAMHLLGVGVTGSAPNFGGEEHDAGEHSGAGSGWAPSEEQIAAMVDQLDILSFPGGVAKALGASEPRPQEEQQIPAGVLASGQFFGYKPAIVAFGSDTTATNYGVSQVAMLPHGQDARLTLMLFEVDPLAAREVVAAGFNPFEAPLVVVIRNKDGEAVDASPVDTWMSRRAKAPMYSPSGDLMMAEDDFVEELRVAVVRGVGGRWELHSPVEQDAVLRFMRRSDELWDARRLLGESWYVEEVADARAKFVAATLGL